MWFFLQDKHNINAVSIIYKVYVYSAQNWKKARRISPLVSEIIFIMYAHSSNDSLSYDYYVHFQVENRK
jgi:hypothetical protein